MGGDSSCAARANSSSQVSSLSSAISETTYTETMTDATQISTDNTSDGVFGWVFGGVVKRVFSLVGRATVLKTMSRIDDFDLDLALNPLAMTSRQSFSFLEATGSLGATGEDYDECEDCHTANFIRLIEGDSL